LRELCGGRAVEAPRRRCGRDLLLEVSERPVERGPHGPRRRTRRHAEDYRPDTEDETSEQGTTPHACPPIANARNGRRSFDGPAAPRLLGAFASLRRGGSRRPSPPK